MREAKKQRVAAASAQGEVVHTNLDGSQEVVSRQEADQRNNGLGEHITGQPEHFTGLLARIAAGAHHGAAGAHTEQLEHTAGQLGVSMAQLALNTEFGNSNTKQFDETTVPSDENTAYLKDTAASFRVMMLADDPTSASVNAATNSL